MNIFYLDVDPKEASVMMCDKHNVKMILESAQMLSTAHRVLDGDDIGRHRVSYADRNSMYRMTHKNHPSTKWVRASSENYLWVYQHMEALMKEYTYRYGKTHATSRLRDALLRPPKNISLSDAGGDPPQCMPDYCKGEDTVLAYQNYYILEKSGFAKWTKREAPVFFVEKYDATRAVLGLHETKT